jgi:hypothetical protein
LPRLRHCLQLLTNKSCLERMGDGFLTCPVATPFDQLVDLVANKLWDPDICLPITPLAAGLTKALYALDTLLIRHDIHLCHS